MLIGLNGLAGSGKDTVADILVKDYRFKRYSFADALRSIALAIDPIVACYWDDEEKIRLSTVIAEDGWDKAKREEPEVRRLLQVIGTEAGRDIFGPNVWVDIVRKKWEEEDKPDAVITDMRFPNEVEWVSWEGGWVVRINRPNNPDAIPTTHASEQYTPTTPHVIENDGTLEELSLKVGTLYDYIWAAERDS